LKVIFFIQNYNDDTGIQVADVIWALLKLEKKDFDAVKAIDNLDSYLWSLYSRASTMLKENEDFAAERDEIHKRIEHKIDPEYQMADHVAGRLLKSHINFMERLGIRYHLLVNESDIVELDFFKETAEILEKEGILYYSEDPKKKGCKVIKYKKENLEKIIVRSNETITYIGKDIAYSFWKMGLFNRDFYYRPFHTYNDGATIYISGSTPGESISSFGKGAAVYNVIDTRQSYLQKIISQVLDSLSTNEDSGNFSHFSYEMVALTPACVKEMGFPITPEEEKKPYIEVSGRKGIAVKADDLLDKLLEKSREEVKKRNPEAAAEKVEDIAVQIAVGALRYFMIKFTSNSVIAFDFKDALSFEGDTGPYLQYTMVRLNSILRKLPDSKLNYEKFNREIERLPKKELDKYYEILLQLSLIESQVQLAVNSCELSIISTYTYSLCQKFNNYYHLFPIISEKDEALKELRLSLLFLFKQTLSRLLAIIGISVPEKM